MGSLKDALLEWWPTDVPVEIGVGWAIWVMGGLALMLWFMRRSRSPRARGLAPLPLPTGTARLSGTHAVARPTSTTDTAVRQSSGTHAAARQGSGTHRAVRPLSGTHAAAASGGTVTYGAPTAPPPRTASGVRPPSAARIPDAYTELSSLLDTTDDPN